VTDVDLNANHMRALMLTTNPKVNLQKKFDIPLCIV